MFDLFNVLFPIIFLLIFIMIIVNFAKGITTWSKNNHSPRLTVFAKVVAKRWNELIINRQSLAIRQVHMDSIQPHTRRTM